nr:ribonuclease H-like domain-containing protein [Tanacetum cinerariifolium]
MAFFSLKTSMWVISSRNLGIQMSNLQILPWTRRILRERIVLEKMHQVTPKECHLHAVKRIFQYLKGHPKLGLWYHKDSPFDLVAYSDSDYGGATQDRKSTTGGDYFEKKLINVDHIHTDENVADLLTKPFDAGRFQYLVGEGSGTPTVPHHTPFSETQPSSHTYISSPSLPTVTTISTALIPTITLSETTPLRQYTRRARIAQSSALPSVADEPASPMRDVSQGEACPTESGFIADQDRTTIAKSSTLPHDSATRVTSPAVAQEVEINKLKERVKLLEDRKGMVAEGSRDNAPIKGRRLDEEEVATERVSSDTKEIRLDEGEVAAEKVSDDTKETVTVLISIDAASVLSSGGVQVVPTAAVVAPANVSISTGIGVVPTASTTISTATPIFATATTVTPYTRRKGKEKMVETHTPKKQKRDFYMAVIRNNLGGVSKIPEGEAAWLKRKGIRSEQESAKKQKTTEEVPEEVKSCDEIPEEKIKELIRLVPIEEVYVKVLQVKHPIIDWKHIDREDLNQLWALVKEILSIRPTTDEKEMEL